MTGKDGYFLAKRQLGESLAYRIEKYEAEAKRAEADGDVHKHIAAKSRVDELEKIRSYVRNVMLWDTDNDKN
ncbi:MAG: hypothetical protein HC840_00115 [Leptolyngbyaceae cyanobacterium RM2_2_4]|nr:hypothetical protein [Leptolyngbyaceae cyanobacterium RM2_2_4]